MKLIIIRGVPGSGKSTLAKRICEEFKATYFEADMYFQTQDGYKFDPSKIRHAHEWCKNTARIYLSENNFPFVIVSNTFTQLWEMKDYIEIAERKGIPVHVITVKGNYDNVHGVPADKVEQMKKRWQDYEGEHVDPSWEDILKIVS